MERSHRSFQGALHSSDEILDVYKRQGQVIGEDFLDPGRTAYDDHIMYQTFDVTELVQAGGNALSATLGRG